MAAEHEADIEIGDAVEVLGSGLIGEVVGLKIIRQDEVQFLVDYVDAVGNPVSVWWRESALTLIDGNDDDGSSGDDSAPTNVIYPSAWTSPPVPAVRLAARRFH